MHPQIIQVDSESLFFSKINFIYLFNLLYFDQLRFNPLHLYIEYNICWMADATACQYWPKASR